MIDKTIVAVVSMILLTGILSAFSAEDEKPRPVHMAPSMNSVDYWISPLIERGWSLKSYDAQTQRFYLKSPGGEVHSLTLSDIRALGSAENHETVVDHPVK